MAYKIDIETRFGIVCNYWKISTVQKDYVLKLAHIVLDGFLNKEMRDLEKDCLEIREIDIHPINFSKVFGTEILDQTGMNDLKSLYEFIKINNIEFNNAEFI